MLVESPFHVKGVLYLGTIAFFEKTVRGGMQSLYDEVRDPELLAFIKQRFLPASWYDVLPAPRLVECEARAMRIDVPGYLLHRTKYQANTDLGGVYRFVLKLASPEMVIKRLPRIATQMFDFATPSFVLEDKGHATMRIAGIPAVCGEWLETSFSVYTETAMRLAGAQGIIVDIRRADEGRRAGEPIIALEIDVRWR